MAAKKQAASGSQGGGHEHAPAPTVDQFLVDVQRDNPHGPPLDGIGSGQDHSTFINWKATGGPALKLRNVAAATAAGITVAEFAAKLRATDTGTSFKSLVQVKERSNNRPTDRVAMVEYEVTK